MWRQILTRPLLQTGAYLHHRLQAEWWAIAACVGAVRRIGTGFRQTTGTLSGVSGVRGLPPGFGKEAAHKPLLWEDYRRKFKGAVPPVKTRIRCRRGKERLCSNPCPICRSNILIDFKNKELLEQFLCPFTGQILPASTTGLCRQQQRKLMAAMEKAWDHGWLPYSIPRKMVEEKKVFQLQSNKIQLS